MPAMGQIKLLIVDDSLLMQRVLSDLLGADGEIEVVGTARNGEEAISKVAQLKPDVVTMDVEMPKMNGLTAVHRIMQTQSTPIVMISALTQREASLTLKALELGAVDYVPKPSGQGWLEMGSVREELVSKVKTAASANLSFVKFQAQTDYGLAAKRSEKVISIAASTGGPPALTKVLTALPSQSPAILIVQHMPKGVTKLFAEGLNLRCKFPVKEAQEGDRVAEGLALVAPGGFHMVVTKDGRIHLNADAPVNYVRPAADVLMQSMASVYGAKNVGVVLTGMGSDGANGVRAIKERGGATIAQDEKTSVVYGMPQVAFKTGCVDVVASLEDIPKEIVKACS
ncbi:MAG: chemotaxis response regulator protein-glutamate methylesterase [Candidatus Bathyarchaeota archaeon]|nr:chemotaxis response regulator protein-glutamate methylesterase [Candidatus Bathyarchaeota archaeon]